MLALGVACLLARHDTQSRTVTGLVVAMLMYNLVATAVLAFAGIGLGLHGMALWPVVVLHAGDGRLVCRLPTTQSVNVKMVARELTIRELSFSCKATEEPMKLDP